MAITLKHALGAARQGSADVLPLTAEDGENLMDFYEEQSGASAAPEIRHRFNETISRNAPLSSWRPRRLS